jgi:hypothetical protein
VISLEQVEDRDAALLLDILVAADDGALVKADVDDAGLAHAIPLAGAASAWKSSALSTARPQPPSRKRAPGATT